MLRLNKHSNCTHTDQHRTCFAPFFAIIFSSFCVFGQSLQEVKLTASDGHSDDRFGFAVAISDNFAIIGANNENNLDGAAYIFQKSQSGWTQLVKLTQPDVAPATFFGFAVAMNGDYAVVGVRNDDDRGVNAGSIYIYKRENESWTQDAKISDANGRSFDYFGNAAAISGDDVIVGAPGDDVAAGAAFIIQRDSETFEWNIHQKLTASDRAANESFGISIALSGDYALIGAHTDDDDGYQSGSAYVFKRNGSEWIQQIKLTVSDAAAEDIFGAAVGISGNYAIVGAMGNDEKAPGAGAAYIFKYDSTADAWQEHTKLTASDGRPSDQFGNAVSISGDYAIVGALMQFNSGKGQAYIFRRDGNNWLEQNVITAGDGVVNDRFGNAVAISGGQAIVGARYDDDHGENSGAAYIYSGFATTVGIGDGRNELPLGFVLEQNYPNPFNPVTAISYQLSAFSDQLFATREVELSIYDLSGRRIATLVRERQDPGSYAVRWSGRDSAGKEVASGVYFCRLVVGGHFSQTRKMVKLR